MNEEPVLYGEPLIGWRVWSVGYAEEGTRLITGVERHIWRPGKPLKAVHEDREGYGIDKGPRCSDAPCAPHVPLTRPGCGIYAFKQPEQLATESYMYLGGNVIGTVYLWGRIYEHERGYRAQYAYPASFVQGFECDIEPLAEIYHIPADKENQLWKSASHNASLKRNPSIYLNPYVMAPAPPLPTYLRTNQYSLYPSQIVPANPSLYGYSFIPATEEDEDYKPPVASPPPMPWWFAHIFWKGGKP
jgi:hypothetical protein